MAILDLWSLFLVILNHFLSITISFKARKSLVLYDVLWPKKGSFSKITNYATKKKVERYDIKFFDFKFSNTEQLNIVMI